MRSLLLLPLVGCTSAPPAHDADAIVGTWERPTRLGVERLVLTFDGRFSFEAPDTPDFGGDADYVDGTYVVERPYLELAGTAADGSAVNVRFTYAVDATSSTFVRGAIVQQPADYGESWMCDYTATIADVATHKSWTVTQYPDGYFTTDFTLAYPYHQSLAEWSGSWVGDADQVRFIPDRHPEHVEVAVAPGARRVATQNDGPGGLSDFALDYQSSLTYARVPELH